MPTFLFHQLVFGPVKSRRLGLSLGVNILPTTKKCCNFNCIYCECGLNPEDTVVQLPTCEEVREQLEQYFSTCTQLPDAITFAGNGEPTIHPEFAKIIDVTLACRDKYAPKAQVVVLSNATMLHKTDVFEALCKVDQNIQKIDSVFLDTNSSINQPLKNIDIEKLTRQLKAFGGKVIIQTLFIRGEFNSKNFDNTSPAEIDGLIEVYKAIKPQYVMVYRIERDTPIHSLTQIDAQELIEIGAKIELAGIKTMVSY